MNKYKNLKNYHQQREDELIQREEKIQEYENIIKNIIKTREYQNKEKIKECAEIIEGANDIICASVQIENGVCLYDKEQKKCIEK